ncbi:hypothetical protein SISSUDRAFT_313985 [Sistotremastrum suecicum HHB10207 ss-3]|uniref:Uncharacterized protein n=1 Tax=Sistotremastrum suecicum HHB10207 ss-3 TaxID=1314776 RepID=A0A165ZBH1_9AGAM|nr:hypothetical protein SISSUDRAFT_313985 [Sistotremastrum suecicum HHB10207 ss-3]
MSRSYKEYKSTLSKDWNVSEAICGRSCVAFFYFILRVCSICSIAVVPLMHNILALRSAVWSGDFVRLSVGSNNCWSQDGADCTTLQSWKLHDHMSFSCYYCRPHDIAIRRLCHWR